MTKPRRNCRDDGHVWSVLLRSDHYPGSLDRRHVVMCQHCQSIATVREARKPVKP